MPPKSKFTKDEIIQIALRLVEREGIEALTARSLGEEAGSSPRPIFTLFNSMEEVKAQVIIAAKQFYNKYIEKSLEGVLPFKGVGLAYIGFAQDYPKLFRLLFMSEQKNVPDRNNILDALDDNSEKILNSIMDSYSLSFDLAKQVYFHLWIYTHGIAVLIVTNVCAFSQEEISEMLTYEFVSIYKRVLGGEK